ncbi:MAG: MmcB family DNA repair protein [Phycisphaerae bacterium]|nr:MmcB family DNA repair protein [Phycisphaerae bacterium]
MTKLTAWKISAELAKRHTQDMFFTEVKNGPTWFGGHSRIDALAIKKSWANPCIVGYEIKVSRSDFLKDNKWQAYLDMCNELYFVCPKDLIALNEVPESCGLKHVNENGYMRTIKKAPYREIEHPAEMYMYLLMNYAGDAKPPFRETRYEQIEAYLQDKKKTTELARNFKSKLIEKVATLEEEKNRADYSHSAWEKERQEYQKMVKMLSEHTGSTYIGNPSIYLKNILDNSSKKAEIIAKDFEHFIKRFKQNNGVTD